MILVSARCQISSVTKFLSVIRGSQVYNVNPLNAIKMHLKCHKLKFSDALYLLTLTNAIKRQTVLIQISSSLFCVFTV